MTVKFPNVKVDLGNLSEEEGNCFAIIARVRKALRKAKVVESEIDAFIVKATAGDYENLIAVVLETVDAKLKWNGE